MLNNLEEVLGNTAKIEAYLIGGVAINSYIEGSKYKKIRPPSPSNDIDFASPYTDIKNLNKIADKFKGDISLLINNSKINYGMQGLSSTVVYDPAPVLTLNEKLNDREIQIFPEFVGPIKVDKKYKSNGLLRVADLDTLVATQLNPMSFDANRLRKIDIAVAAECERTEEPSGLAYNVYYSGAKKICKAVNDVEKIAEQTYSIMKYIKGPEEFVNSYIKEENYTHDGYIDSMKKTVNEFKNLKNKENKVIKKYSDNKTGKAVEYGLEIFYEEIKGI
ncbi:MAG: hypothetical protein BJBARM4_0877 [Candidatus Parvarchaeum acidiphilum ARMAN-4]|jgi:hypothetical protein|uniref:Uncharacterized protein n=1 Tax=Candidatus Parvarchaeum acidiphilum ARMAN-4 TaxID=662760 RepID=D2EGH8_PARA4|nr:MAG: hypothetical protein BJBARM4_0877 [Candidatus Parvarchaeum acidiphilum ARMAN-4]